MYMEPQQQLFTRLRKALPELGYDVYDGDLPPDGVPYPFIYLGENETIDSLRKDAVQGTVYQTIHVYSNDIRRRGTMSHILFAVKTVLRQIEADGGWCMESCNTQIMPDTTTSEPLLHGIIEAGFKF